MWGYHLHNSIRASELDNREDEGILIDDVIAWIVYVVWFIGFCLAIRVIWKKYTYNRTHETIKGKPNKILFYHLLFLVIMGGISLFIMLGIGGAIWFNWFFGE
jgi:hypothetical protein